MISDHKATWKADMIAIFPDFPAMIQGEPTMREFLRILQHLVDCAQLHNYLLSPLNLLYMCLPVEQYTMNTQHAYPQDVPFPGDMVSEYWQPTY